MFTYYDDKQQEKKFTLDDLRKNLSDDEILSLCGLSIMLKDAFESHDGAEMAECREKISAIEEKIEMAWVLTQQ